MSRPIVVIICMASSSESWEPQQRPHPWHSRAGGGAVHSITSRLMHRRCGGNTSTDQVRRHVPEPPGTFGIECVACDADIVGRAFRNGRSLLTVLEIASADPVQQW